jgi:short-subunit dehydrogenase
VHYFAPRATRTAFNSQSVDEMNEVLGNALDPPEKVARTIVQALQADQPECVIGWPEKFFARVNALLPRLVDAALAQKLPTIQRFARRSMPATQPKAAFIESAAHPRNSI